MHQRAPKRPVHKTFAISGLAGFIAGMFVVAGVVWQFGNFVGSRDASRQWPAAPQSAMHRWGSGFEEPPTRIEGIPLDERPVPLPDVAPLDTPVPAAARPAPPAEPTIGATPMSALRDRNLMVPVQGIDRDDLQASFGDARGGYSRMHEAIDILAPRNTPVLAADDGTIARLFFSKDGGITVYQFDVTQNYVYYYAHLEKYADNITAGDQVKRGQVLGYVGTTGNAPENTPHLHFAIYRVTQQKKWWGGIPLDPYQVLR